MSCLVCGDTASKLFNIYTNYGVIDHTVYDDIAEIYGEKARAVLKSDENACNICMNNLENIVKLIRKVWMLITNNAKKTVKFEKVWNHFAKLKFAEVLEDSWIDEINKEQVNDPKSLNRIPTPNLLRVQHTDEYDPELEEVIAQEEYWKSNNLSADDEVRKLFSKRKKRGSKPRWTHTKRRRAQSSTSGISSVSTLRSYYPTTPLSVLSEDSIATKVNGRIPLYDNQHRLIGNRTRSVTRHQEEEIQDWQSKRFDCSVENCPIESIEDHDVMNDHMIEDHQIPALYFCEECNARYTTRDLLRHHAIVHETQVLNCLMCGEEYPNSIALQAHMNQHSWSNIHCDCCDKFFLSQAGYKIHRRWVHKGEKQTRKKMKTNLILAEYKSRRDMNNDVKRFLQSNYGQ